MELLAHAFDRSPVPKLVLSLAPDDCGRFTAVNDAFCDLVGWSRDELLGQPALMLLDSDRLGPVTALAEAMVRGDLTVMAMERILIRRDGSRVWTVSQNLLVHDRDGLPFLFAEIVESSGRQVLADSEARFRTLVDSSPIGMAVLDTDGAWLRVNPAVSAMLGRTGPELAALTLADVTHPDDRTSCAAMLRDMASGRRTTFEGDFRYVGKDGHRLWCRLTVTPLASESGTPMRLLAQLADVSTERRNQERLSTTIAVQREIGTVTDRDALLRLIADRTLQVLPSGTVASVHLLDPAATVLRPAATAGHPLPELPVARSLAGLTITSGRTARSDDTTTDPRVNPMIARVTGMRSMVVAPLRAPDSGTFGVLMVGSDRPGAFHDTDEQQLALLAEGLSAALRHADDAARNTEALRALEVSEHRFRLIFDNSPLGLTLCSLRPEDFGRYLQANPAMTAITGWTQDELTRMTFAELTHPDDVVETRQLAKRLIDRELDAVTVERRYRHRDGHTIWVSVRVALITDEQDRARYVVNQVEDITAAHEADVQLRRTARLFELIPAAVIVRDLDGTIRWWNDGATRLYGWPLAAASGRSAHRLLHTTFPYGGSFPDQEEALRRDGFWNGQLDHITASGRTVNVLSRQVLHHLDPDHAQVLEVNADQTAARAAEVALAESEERLRAQFANTGVGQTISALDGSLISANRAYAAMVGRTGEQLAGLHDRDLLHPEDLAAHRALLAGLFAGDAESYTTEARIAHSDGHWVPVEATISLVRDPAGNPKLVVGVLTDITARRAAEQARDAASAALAERNTELEAANQLKLDIIGMLGHEIGNPLTSIRGNAEILTDDWAALTDERRARAIDAIARQAGTLDEIVQEVLAMVTIESGQIRADRRELNLHEEISRALWAADATIPVSGPPARVLCHPGHLQQILVNLLSNARKYGGGATAVRVAVTPSHVEVAVEDDGPGVPEEFRDRLFERLARADRDATSVKGTGLGLYIVRGLAQANHGDIRHEPSPSGGSRFVISLESPGPDRE
ncbi:PAS domain S-box protein [Actinoplanes sp. NPDC020271]|uniref:PAS domain S-box protein n=1 Tax=Actinoplanes sp. NPDC020271 TaxID=3363896 RepID=UPI00378836D8